MGTELAKTGIIHVGPVNKDIAAAHQVTAGTEVPRRPGVKLAEPKIDQIKVIKEARNHVISSTAARPRFHRRSW